MKKIFSLMVYCLLITQTCFSQQADNTVVSLVPYPHTILLKPGKMAVRTDLVLYDVSGNEEIKQIIKTCMNDFKEIGFSVADSQKRTFKSGKATSVYLKMEGNGDVIGDESYRLTIDTCISIYAASPAGIFWGTRTVLQLLHQSPDKLIPKLEISDQPAYKYRGVMVDVARYFHSMEFHIQTLKKMAYYKLNHYMIHFSDHESYTLPSDVFPGLPTQGRHYTKEEIRQLVDAARKYHITIVPSVDMPGHTGALIKAIPELGFGDAKKIDIAKEESYQILEKLFTELMELFPGPYWHLGADEVGYPNKNDSPSIAYTSWMGKVNITQGGQLLNYFINRMYEFIKNKGYKVFVWEGFKPNLEPKVNRDIIVCPFDVKHEGIMPNDYMKAGYKILNTSWAPLYIVRAKITTPETLAKWTPNMFGAGASPQPFGYWKKYTPDEIPTEIIGAQMCSWENEEKAEWGLMFGEKPGFPEYGRPGPRVQIFSERIWNINVTGEKNLLERTGAAYWDF
jgi:hexosaminidase